jgi:hypothetical protein
MLDSTFEACVDFVWNQLKTRGEHERTEGQRREIHTSRHRRFKGGKVMNSIGSTKKDFVGPLFVFTLAMVPITLKRFA